MIDNIDQAEFTIFDTETTGLNPQEGDRIVEIAAIRFKGSEKIAVFQHLVNPHRRISEAAFAVNRITEDMLRGAPDIEKVLPEFLEFIRGSYLCSYNAGFDLRFLNNELGILGRPALKDIIIVDILKMARRLLPGIERYALWFVAEHLGIKIKQQHRALSDVELTLGVFNRFKESLKGKGITDITNFSSLFSISPDFLDNINNQKLTNIQQAIDLGVKLKIKYLASSNAQVSEREIVPKQIRQEKGNDYLVAHCCLRNDERTFRIDGILHIETV